MPFYVALPSPTIDWSVDDGIDDIPIEERERRRGHAYDRPDRRRARSTRCDIVPEGSPVANYAFDVTPARLVTGLITERGVCAGIGRRLAAAFPERTAAAAE